MMSVGPTEAGRLTYWQYTAMRAIWCDRHDTDGPGGEPIDPPSEDFIRAAQAELVELGISGTKH